MLKSLFQVNGSPFFSIGGQTNNSSAYDKEAMQRAFAGIEAMGMNTIAAPVYWETLEPEEGRYCFWQMDMIVEEARKRGLKAVLLWFGTWKNGASHYVPEWMKKDAATYRPVYTKSGLPTTTLSPHCAAVLNKDKKAFIQLMTHLKEINKDETVLAVQVENEPGLLGTSRDYSVEADVLFHTEIPEEVRDWLEILPEGKIIDIYEEHGRSKKGDWQKTFGFHASEIFSAYHFAKFVDEIAAEGKLVYPLPMYTNAWPREQGNRLAGIDFPSGGAATLVLDIWKKFAPHLDCLSPDIYYEDYFTYHELCEAYKRPDNILYIPESKANESNGMHILRMIEDCELSSVHCFAVDSIFDNTGSMKPECLDFKDTITILKVMKPLLEKYQGTGKIKAVTQYAGMDMQFMDFGDYYGRVCYLNSIKDEPYLHLDPWHNAPELLQNKAKGLIIYEGKGSFYLAGRGYKLELLQKSSIEEMTDVLYSQKVFVTRNIAYLRVEEGELESDGSFRTKRRRNGDETDTGLWVEPDIGLLHVVLPFREPSGN